MKLCACGCGRIANRTYVRGHHVKTSRPVLERFWEKVEKSEGCWKWKGTKKFDGYGGFWPTPKAKVSAHRFSWELHYGQIPPGMKVLHRCDNPECTRPDHLFLGTELDNARDCAQKERYNPHCKILTAQQVREIRRKIVTHKPHGIFKTVAQEYGVSPETISHIYHRRTWAWLPESESA